MAPPTVQIKDNLIILSRTAVRALLDGKQRCPGGYLVGHKTGVMAIWACPPDTAGGRQLGAGRVLGAKKIIQALGLPQRTAKCPAIMIGQRLVADIVPIGRPRKEGEE